MAYERGLVISSPVRITGNGLTFGGGLDPQELRWSLLFWDKLDHPSNNLVGFSPTPDEQFLIDAKVLRRTHIYVTGSGNFGEAFAQAHVAAFRLLEQAEPGTWSLATGERSFSFDDNELEIGRGALVRLYQAILVPDKDVPLEDILEFRAKRNAELLALRHNLEAIYQRVITAGDGALAFNTEIEALQTAIAAHVRVSRDAGFKLRPVSLSIGLNVVRGATIAAGAFSLGLPAVAAVATGLVAAISIGPGASLIWGQPTGTPFRYISAFHNELF